MKKRPVTGKIGRKFRILPFFIESMHKQLDWIIDHRFWIIAIQDKENQSNNLGGSAVVTADELRDIREKLVK